jgi:membrane-bound lytic murein transglycosylase D
MRIRNLLIIIAAFAIQACTTLPPNSSENPVTPVSVVPEAVQPASVAVTSSAGTATTDHGATPPLIAASQQETSDNHYADIWQRIRANLTLDRHTKKRLVKSKLGWYRRNQDFLDRTADRAAPYIYYIVQELDKRDMPLDLALLPIIESAYHPFANSPSRASGIWQFIPSTGRLYGLKQNWWYDGRRDIVAATRAALDYLEKLHKDFNGDWLLALAAYNSGELSVSRAIRKNLKRGKKTDFWSLHLPRETRGYVPSLLAVAELVSNPKRYHVKLKPVPNEPYFSKVAISGQLDLALAANLADVSMDDIYTLNPGFNQWATDPDGPYRLLIPVDKTQQFIQRLENIDAKDRIAWKRHKIQPGESLNLIARHNNTSIKALMRVNGLHSHLIRVGHSLLIPTSKQPLKYYTLSVASRRYRGLQKASGDKYVYKVKRGDTLWDISRDYGVSVKSLLVWNNLSIRKFLRPGQKINIVVTNSSSSKVDESSAAQSTVAVSDDNTGQNTITYTIRSGDSLWIIANRYNVTVRSLQTLNSLPSGAVLHPGQKLTIKPVGSGTYPVALDGQDTAPVNYTVRRGDSLWLISKRFGTTVAKLRRWNKLPKGKLLQPGQVLVLYVQEA